MPDKDKYNYWMALAGISGWIACVILLLFNQYFRKSEYVQLPGSITKETHYYYDSTKKPLVVKVPVPVTFTVPVPQLIDTAAVFKSYFSKNFYSQTLQDSSVRITINDTVSQNKIISRIPTYQWLKPVKTTEASTVIVEHKQKPSIYVGGFLDVNRSYIHGYGPEVYLKLNNRYLLKANYDIKNNSFGFGGGINPFANAGNRDKVKP